MIYVGKQGILIDHMVHLFQTDDFSLFQNLQSDPFVGDFVTGKLHSPEGASSESMMDLIIGKLHFLSFLHDGKKGARTFFLFKTIDLCFDFNFKFCLLDILNFY